VLTFLLHIMSFFTYFLISSQNCSFSVFNFIDIGNYVVATSRLVEVQFWNSHFIPTNLLWSVQCSLCRNFIHHGHCCHDCCFYVLIIVAMTCIYHSYFWVITDLGFAGELLIFQCALLTYSLSCRCQGLSDVQLAKYEEQNKSSQNTKKTNKSNANSKSDPDVSTRCLWSMCSYQPWNILEF